MKKIRWKILFFFLISIIAGLLFVVSRRPAPRPPRKISLPAPRPETMAQKSPEHGVMLSYDVYAAGFRALDATLNAGTTEKTYDIKMTAVTKGLIGRLFPWRTTAETSGTIDASGGLIPDWHHETSDWRKHTYVEKISYDAAGVMQTRALTDNGKPMKSQPVNPKLAAGAGDVLTATLALLQNTTNTGKCKGSYPVYDGRRRYDVTLTDAGTDTLPKSRYSIFTGKALRCTLKLVPVGGFTASDKKRGWWRIQSYTERHNKPPTIWLAKIHPDGKDDTSKNNTAGKNMDIIVRMEIDSSYGAAVANLTGEKPY